MSTSCRRSDGFWPTDDDLVVPDADSRVFRYLRFYWRSDKEIQCDTVRTFTIMRMTPLTTHYFIQVTC
jgi:hypothetical protein